MAEIALQSEQNYAGGCTVWYGLKIGQVSGYTADHSYTH
jgi:hypothetical protein